LGQVDHLLAALSQEPIYLVAALGFDDKRLALRALEIKAVATETSVNVRGVVVDESGIDILTIARISACSYFDAKEDNREYQWVLTGQL